MNAEKFTGERFILGQGSVELAYEHLHRYFFALRWARGKRVLDVASGSGYGSALLAGVADRVWALDIDGPAVVLARSNCTAGPLAFVQADAEHLPIAAASLDLVVAFEVIEHLRDPQGLVREVARVLKPAGVALLSTPDKATYSDARQYVNPFHVREFYRDEFQEMLKARFSVVRMMGQRVRAGSLIGSDPVGEGQSEVYASPLPDAGRGGSPPMYWLAICSQRELPAPTELSAYLDPTDSMMEQWCNRLDTAAAEIERLNAEIRVLGGWGKELEGCIVERDRTIASTRQQMDDEMDVRDQAIRSLQEAVSMRDREISRLQNEFAAEVARRDRTIQTLQEEFDDRTEWALSLQEQVRDRDTHLDHANAALSAAAERLARIRHALLYRVLCRLGILPK
jgi:ubiquinone/menaquinone biosynthesis C-methylase UbiE